MATSDREFWESLLCLEAIEPLPDCDETYDSIWEQQLQLESDADSAPCPDESFTFPVDFENDVFEMSSATKTLESWTCLNDTVMDSALMAPDPPPVPRNSRAKKWNLRARNPANRPIHLFGNFYRAPRPDKGLYLVKDFRTGWVGKVKCDANGQLDESELRRFELSCRDELIHASVNFTNSTKPVLRAR